jgi:small subunit ribosomal protein S27e
LKKRRRETIPKPRSNFIKVKCPECGNEQVVFDRASITVHCNICNAVVAEPTGGKASVKGTIVAALE